MKIEYDIDFEKVMNELQANFGWSNIDVLPDSYKDLLNDTIKAVKNCSISDVVKRSEQLICDTCKSGLIDYPDINRRTCRCGGLGYNVTD